MLAVADKIGTSQEETALAAFDDSGQKIRARQGSDEDKHGARRDALDFAGIGTKHGNFFEMSFAMNLGHAGMGPQLNVRRLFNLVDQILRHGAGERFAAHKNNDALGVAGEVHGCLSRRVRAAYHVDDLTLTGQGFGCAATVVNSGTLQPVDPRSIQAPPLHASRDHQRVARNLASIHKLDDSVRAFDTDADNFLRRQDFYPETLGLHDGTPGEIGAAEATGKSKIVFDARAHAGLTTGSFALNHHGVQTFGSSINGSGQAGRTTAHDRTIVTAGLSAGAQSHFLRYVGGHALQKL